MLLAPRMAVVGLTPYHNTPVPNIPVAMANNIAARLLTNPRTNGLFRVLLIFASCCGSKSMFKVFADAMHAKVPLVRKASVSVLREGASVTDVLNRAGTG